MLRLTRKTDLALLVLTTLAAAEGAARRSLQPFVSVQSLVRAHRVPYRFTAEIVRLLAGAGILAAREGRRGGYRLARAPSRITVADVVRATGDGAVLAGCLDPATHGACPQKPWCLAQGGMRSLQEQLLAPLRTMTVADFVREHARHADSH